MRSSKKSPSKVLGKINQQDAEKLLEWLVNWPPPPEDTLSLSEYRSLREAGAVPASDEYRKEIAEWLIRTRKMTGQRWPDLWRDEAQAITVLRRAQRYLQAFWGTQDPHARDWYIHRAREWFRRHQVQSKVLREYEDELRGATTALEGINLSSQINAEIESYLEQPPPRSPFEDSLFYLQNLGDLVKTCANQSCQSPYFIAGDKRRKYCSDPCSWLADKKSKRESYDRHPEWAANRTERKDK